MPRVGQMKKSKFLKRDHLSEEGVVVTIRKLYEKNAAPADARPDLKWCMAFHEFAQPLVLNATNLDTCERLFGSDNSDDWIGKALVVYDDPSIQYGGKTVGGIRIRKPNPGDRPPPKQAARDDDADDADGEERGREPGDDVPWDT